MHGAPAGVNAQTKSTAESTLVLGRPAQDQDLVMGRCRNSRQAGECILLLAKVIKIDAH